MSMSRFAGQIVIARLMCHFALAILLFQPAFATAASGVQANSTMTNSAMNRYRVLPNLTHLVAGGLEQKLDLYLPNQTASTPVPTPTLIYIHGGGWVQGSKEAAVLAILPFLERGWAVANVNYRLAKDAVAPAAVEDCRCALRWIIEHGAEYSIDIHKIVVMGHSAGGHLALTTGMLPESAGLDRQCPGNRRLRVAAVIDWFGITDVGDLLEGPNQKNYAVMWLGSALMRKEIAARVSPLSYVGPDLPPILMIHGEADPTVPYSHSVRLHEALDAHHARNELLTIPGGLHGNFSDSEMDNIYAHIWSFIDKFVEHETRQ